VRRAAHRPRWGGIVRTGDDAAGLRARLTDARALCTALDLFQGSGGRKPHRAGPGGYLVRCPWCNGGKDTPPCSVTPGPDRTLRVKCFSCGEGGDALSLIAAAQGLDIRADFPAVLGEAARIAGAAPPVGPSRRRFVQETCSTSCPEEGEVSALWQNAYPIEADDEARAYLEGRAIDPGMVDLYDLARVLQTWASAPSWARCRGKSWTSTHRLILPVVDYLGAVRSLRAWRCSPQAPDDDTPKRVAPAGKSLSGLILACPEARRMLATGKAPSWASKGRPLDVVITEGEPDFLTWASRVSDADETPPVILGVVAGSWCDAIAARIPDGARVIVRTHQDPTGERYAAEVRESLAGRAVTLLRAKGAGHGAAA
jgi:hypothetical protein